MPAAIHLEDIIEALEMQSDESLSFLDLDTGKALTVSRALMGKAEDGLEPELHKWQEDEWKDVNRIVSSDRCVRLPTKFDVHEWALMEEFSNSVESDGIREDLMYAIHGAGAFRHFKAAIRRHRIEQDWYAFRADALKQIAIDWCEGHGIAWE